MGFFWQEYWSGVPFPPPRDLPDPGMEYESLTSALEGGFFTAEPPGKPSGSSSIYKITQEYASVILFS